MSSVLDLRFRPRRLPLESRLTTAHSTFENRVELSIPDWVSRRHSRLLSAVAENEGQHRRNKRHSEQNEIYLE